MKATLQEEKSKIMQIYNDEALAWTSLYGEASLQLGVHDFFVATFNSFKLVVWSLRAERWINEECVFFF